MSVAERLTDLASDLPAVRWVDETGSTNADARAWARAGAPHGAAVLAGRQTAGRGRLGRSWESPPGAVLVSVVLRPRLRLEHAALLSLAAAVAVSGVCGTPVGIKWPNDVLAPDGRKLAGVLAEVEAVDGWVDAAIVGVGLNVAAAPASVPTATCLEDLDPRGRDPLVVALALVRALVATCGQVPGDRGAVLAAWRRGAITLGSRVSVGDVVGTAVDIDDDGALLVRAEEGQVHRVLAGDVHPADGGSLAVRRR